MVSIGDTAAVPNRPVHPAVGADGSVLRAIDRYTSLLNTRATDKAAL